MSVMKTSLTIFPCVLGSAFPIIRVCPGLSFATKRIGPPCCTLFTFVTCCSLKFILSQNYLLPLISVLAENTLLKTAYHFLLLLVGFDTLTYRKDYDRSPILVGHHTNTDPLVNRRVEAFECAEGASSAGRAADEGGVVTVVACTHSAYC